MIDTEKTFIRPIAVSRAGRSRPAANAGDATPRRRICIVSGTRPEIIKLAPVYQRLRETGWAAVDWIHTGQHADMAEAMFQCFNVEPTVRLERAGATLAQFSSGCRRQLDELFSAQRFDMCLVQGDTESAFLGALAGFYQGVPVGHVEAGLRTHQLDRPFPEEGLRQMISRVASLHFAPTRRAYSALLVEGIAADKILVTGNTVVDAQLWACEAHQIRRRSSGIGAIVVTVHRREHWGGEMAEIFAAVAQIAREHPQVQVVFPVHLNPVVQIAARSVLEGIPNVRLVAPLDYLSMQQALADAAIVLTDSGGLQEEAPTHNVPVLVLRRETERPEAVEAGCAVVVGPSRQAIVRETARLLHEASVQGRIARPNPYGDGQAAGRIVARIASRLGVEVRSRGAPVPDVPAQRRARLALHPAARD